MATTLAHQPNDADNPTDWLRHPNTAASSDWHRVGRFHDGTSHHDALSSDAGYTTATASVPPFTSNSSCLQWRESIYGMSDRIRMFRAAGTSQRLFEETCNIIGTSHDIEVLKAIAPRKDASDAASSLGEVAR